MNERRRCDLVKDGQVLFTNVQMEFNDASPDDPTKQCGSLLVPNDCGIRPGEYYLIQLLDRPEETPSIRVVSATQISPDTATHVRFGEV